ncbi:MAG: hypothetical protein KME07_03220 [Pegethrix bostrychoides GSE-TBD4-15B]|jgi:hypothetical protein|uniref:Uncharacterized protein n=1 Tax=Pegethrix bostrychoides GSE-TBD4-15B TaxID=2839662 RepID=A0A951P790_9CYAN|nr:hypothetical protein [Pegethrix bostrychoides GSE-TBD4-15B]
MPIYQALLWLNGGFLLLIAALTGYVELSGLSVKALFLHPESYPHITIGALTHLFQMLCAVPPIVCLFTYSLLRSQPFSESSSETRFILASALFTGGFLLNEIYRIHIHLSASGIGKPTVILVYAVVLALYLVSCRQQILQTPYLILLLGVGILAVGIGIDSLHIPNQGLTDFLEGIPKVLSQANIALYFWIVCQQAISRFAGGKFS